MAANFKVKFFFADATTIEETFPPQVTVAEAKSKLIASWPEGDACCVLLVLHSPPSSRRAFPLGQHLLHFSFKPRCSLFLAEESISGPSIGFKSLCYGYTHLYPACVLCG